MFPTFYEAGFERALGPTRGRHGAALRLPRPALLLPAPNGLMPPPSTLLLTSAAGTLGRVLTSALRGLCQQLPLSDLPGAPARP